MTNIPAVKIGIVAVSRDCFPERLAVDRRRALAAAYEIKYGKSDIYECPVCVVESEVQAAEALADIKRAGCTALCVYLGNFGPEISETMLAQNFDGPVMFCAAAEETTEKLMNDRGDAFCGMLNACYNLKLRGVKAYIPPYPVGNAGECADMIRGFVPIARALVGVKNLKIISFGPRPKNFMACNAPIARLYTMGVEIEENSELDLFEAFNRHAGDARIPGVIADMEAELGKGNKKPEILAKLAQYELTLLDWIEAHRESRKYVAIAGKCWPAFQTQFGFVPCYVNSRLTGRGIPVSCEVDIYGCLSEYNRYLRQCGRRHAAGREQYRAPRYVRQGNRRKIRLCADRYLYGISLRQHVQQQGVRSDDEVSENHGQQPARRSDERHARRRSEAGKNHVVPLAEYGG